MPNYNQSGVLTWQPSFPDDGDKGWNTCPVGALDIYCGYFGSGKTLSLVHKVVGLYNRYNDKPVWCNRRKKFVTQKIVLLSNVDLAVPYVKLDSLAQVVKMSKVAPALDDENDTLTVTIVAMDELSVQMNSRSFKDNFNAYFLNTLLCCRHYHISFTAVLSVSNMSINCSVMSHTQLFNAKALALPAVEFLRCLGDGKRHKRRDD